MKTSHLIFTLIAVIALQIPDVAYAGKSKKGSHKRNNLPQPVNNSDYYDNGAPSEAKVSLGSQLFFDKVLSGNFNISCATCHHSFTGTSDGLALPVGEGASGLGVARDTGYGADAIHERVPRNAPHIFNLGAREFDRIFHDGRLESSPGMPSNLQSPAGLNLPDGLDNALAAQAMFPVTSGTEMAGQAGENPIADAAAVGNLAGPGGVWEQLAERLRGIEGYVSQFVDVFPDVSKAEDIEYRHAANAIAAFEASNWRADNSPFDRYLRGDRGAMSKNAIEGMRIFYSPKRGNCASCHSGTFQTDHTFRAIAMPQVGPGKGHGDWGYEDFGREAFTGNPSDRYKFRVPTLRNVAQTAPYGHAGTYNSLEAVVRHHINPVRSLRNYDTAQLRLPSRPDLNAIDLLAMNDPSVVDAIASANELAPVRLKEKDIEKLLDFLHALTDPAMLDMRRDVPLSLPSGLSLAD